jgi:predicted trehalose synthase
MIKLTENTFSKKIALKVNNIDKIFTLNLVEAEYCVYFWRKMLFEKNLIEKFPLLSLELTLYTEQFEDEINMEKVQNLIKASIYPDRYEFSIEQLGKGNTTNMLFMLNLHIKKTPKTKPITYVLKSYKEYTENIEPSILKVLMINNFPNTPKIYGTVKIKGIETIGIIENVHNIGNLGGIYWNEVNEMINDVFKDINKDYSSFKDKSEISTLIKDYLVETLKVSEEIGLYINKLHEFLILPDDNNYSLETIESESYLKKYTENLNSMIAVLQNNISQNSENAFYNLPKINSILIDTKDIIEKFRSEFKFNKIKIQPIHQDLHMEQILYNKSNEQYQFYFIDFEGDPQLTVDKKKGKFPIEKDIASFLRSLNYIKFNTFLNFIEKNIIQRNKYEVAEEILYSIFFRKAAKSKNKVLEVVLNILNVWEEKLIAKFLKILKPNIILTNYFTIERALYELNYEILFRPSKIIVPLLGLNEIIDKNS